MEHEASLENQQIAQSKLNRLMLYLVAEKMEQKQRKQEIQSQMN